MTDEKKMPRCEMCDYCKYPRTTADNSGACKCKLMKYKTIDVIVTNGGSPAWCPLKKLTDGNPIVEGGFLRDCCICGKPFAERGYNPAPIETDGVCCKECNDKLVIPRRMRDITIARIQRDADALAATAAGNHASTKLNAFVGKPVVVKTWDGSTERGVLHIDTLATRLHSADAAHADNTRVIGYYLDRGSHGCTHFKKTHIITIALDNIARRCDMFKFLKFKEKRSNGDSTTNYDVEFEKGLTIRQLVDIVLRHSPDEWGRITLTAEGYKRTDVIEYKHGKIVNQDPLFDLVADAAIVELKAQGGYSLMNYYATIYGGGRQ
ncbi:MAG: hypothetical protein K2O35_05570 [Clostridia bacterium]|nr:hypothetical protein [Clostridia bacterium]